ncbi:hypothetical protein D3C87_55530 [compost metagenome]
MPSARIGRKVIIRADSDKMPTSTAAKSGLMANQPMAKIIPAVDKSFAKASMLSPCFNMAYLDQVANVSKMEQGNYRISCRLRVSAVLRGGQPDQPVLLTIWTV